MTGIVGALANLGHAVSDQTVGNVLRRYGIAPAPKRSQTTTWKQFIAAHMDVLAGTDFFFHGRGPDMAWPGYLLRSVLSASGDPACHSGRHHAAPHGRVDEANRWQCDRRGIGVSCSNIGMCSTTAIRRSALNSARPWQRAARSARLPPRSPNLNAFSEWWVRSVKSECLSKLIIFGESSLLRFGQLRTLSGREEPSRQRQQAAVFSSTTTTFRTGNGSMPGAIGWAAQVLIPRGGLMMGSRFQTCWASTWPVFLPHAGA